VLTGPGLPWPPRMAAQPHGGLRSLGAKCALSHWAIPISLPNKKGRQSYAAALGEDELGWRARLRAVRRAAVKLALAGRLVITRKGKVVDPADFRGVYQLGALRQD
jgi:Protein of unknown function (DUF3253)